MLPVGAGGTDAKKLLPGVRTILLPPALTHAWGAVSSSGSGVSARASAAMINVMRFSASSSPARARSAS